MAYHTTRKSTAEAKRETLRRRNARMDSGKWSSTRRGGTR